MPEDPEQEQDLSPRTPGLIHMAPDSETEPEVPKGRAGARASAVQALYESELTGHSAQVALDHIAARDGLTGGQSAFAAELVELVRQGRRALDDRIAVLAPARPLERIDLVDRVILQLALAELDRGGDDPTPPAVVVNEAVELARLYGSETSPRFVNGVLGTVLR